MPAKLNALDGEVNIKLLFLISSDNSEINVWLFPFEINSLCMSSDRIYRLCLVQISAKSLNSFSDQTRPDGLCGLQIITAFVFFVILLSKSFKSIV